MLDFTGSKTGVILKFRLERDNIKVFDKPDDKCPTLEAYNRERFSKAATSMECVINPSTDNNNVIFGAGDGTFCHLNPKLQEFVKDIIINVTIFYP